MGIWSRLDGYTRWITFSDFVQQTEIDIDLHTKVGLNTFKYQMEQQILLLTSVLMVPSKEPHMAWSEKLEQELLAKMLSYQTPDNQYKAYRDLLAYEPLCMKIGCAVAKKYLIQVLANLLKE